MAKVNKGAHPKEAEKNVGSDQIIGGSCFCAARI
jgi:hypothetical protein